MIRRIVRKGILIFVMAVMLCQPVFAAAEQTEAAEQELEEQALGEDIDKSDIETIQDEDVPLALPNRATFNRYKRDVVIMLFFGTLIVVTTVGATIKEKQERNRLN